MAPAQPGRRILWQLGFVVVAAFVIYGFYVVSHYERIRDWHQRQLADAAAELVLSHGTARWSVDRFLGPADARPGGRPADDAPPRAATGPEQVARFDAEQPYVTSTACTATPFEIGRPGLCFVFEPKLVLRELASLDAFNLILISDEAGEVLQGVAPERAWLKHLRWGERAYRDAGADRAGQPQIEHLASLFDAQTWTQMKATSSRTMQEIGGQRFELFFEPLVLQSGGAPLVLVGAVSSQAILGRALAVDSYFLAALVFLLLLGALGFPFVKLLSLAPRERFRQRDVALLYVSTAALLALFTFAAHGIDGYARWSDAADDGLRGLAARIERAYLDELGTIARYLAEADEAIGGWPDLRAHAARADWSKTPEAAGTETAARLPIPTPAIDVEQLFLVSPQGGIVWRAIDGVASASDVSGRTYFRSVREGHLFSVGSGLPPVFAGPDRSLRDGRFYTFVALPSRRDRDAGFVLTAMTRLQALGSLALPAGYGFAVINREGRVLYHSDERLALRENFFDNMSGSDRARAMVYASRSGFLTSHYRERPHRLYVHPAAIRLQDEPERGAVSVVTFRDTTIERSVVARVFVTALLGPVPIAVIFIALSMLAIALVPIRRRQRWSVWLWPHGGLAFMYRRLTAVLACLVAGAALWWVEGGPEIGYAVLPVVAMGAAIATYALSTQRPARRSRLSAAGWYAAGFCLLLVASVVVPASAFFRAALAHEWGKLIVTERAWIRAQQHDIPQQLRAASQSDRLRPDAGPRLAAAKAQRLAEIAPPGPFDAAPPETSVTPAWLLAPFHWVDAVLPIENDISARQWYEDHEAIHTPAGRLPMSSGGGVTLLAVLGGLVWWLRWKVRNLYFADRSAAAPLGASAEQIWESCSLDEKLVLLHCAHEHVVNPHQRAHVERLLDRGLLTLDPDLKPATPELTTFLRSREVAMSEELREWETVDSAHSWHYMRLVLGVSLVGILLFLTATQPGLQAGLVAATSAVAGIMTTALKLRDAVAAWLSGRRTAA